MADQGKENGSGGSDTGTFTPMRGRPTAAQSRAITHAIMEAATKQFLAVGYELTTMEAIAKEAGIPKSTLYKRYIDKKSLLKTVIEDQLKRWEKSYREIEPTLPSDLESRLKERLRAVVEWNAKDEVRAFTRLAMGTGEGPEVVSEVMSKVGNTLVMDRLERDIRLLHPGAGDPKSVAVALWAIMAGWFATRRPEIPFDQAASEAFCDRAVELLLHGKERW